MRLLAQTHWLQRNASLGQFMCGSPRKKIFDFVLMKEFTEFEAQLRRELYDVNGCQASLNKTVARAKIRLKVGLV